MFAGYAAGFVTTTAALHLAGVGAALALRQAGARIWQLVGAILGAASLALLSQI
jgi:urease accessory protein